MNHSFHFFLLLAAALCSAPAEVVDLSPHHDEKRPLANPHKGWYHHYPDNSLEKYKIRRDADLLEFPGMDHLYMRLAWSYLEPAEGEYDWEVIDRIIRKWTGHGLGIAFRITCRETGTKPIEQQFATPRWVMEAGAKGDHYYKRKKTGPTGPWEPVFDDPVFMEKLENFLEAFATRYDGSPWLRYVDIGSIGDWGEGHTTSGSGRHYGYDQRKPHVDLHLKYFKKTPLVISDDFVQAIPDKSDQVRLHRHIVSNGITYRDDSILVDYYVRAYAATFCVRTPSFFADTWRTGPNVLELQHYRNFKKDGNWTADPGSSMAKLGDGRTGPDFFRGAVKLLRATYLGYHGHAHEWLAENPDLTVELLNKCGYWYFLHRATLPEHWTPGTNAKLTLAWQNRGVAPAYHDFQLLVRLKGEYTSTTAHEAGNRSWLPEPEGKLYSQTYAAALPDSLPPGRYELGIKLRSPSAGRDVALAMHPDLIDEDGFCRITTVKVTPHTPQP